MAISFSENFQTARSPLSELLPRFRDLIPTIVPEFATEYYALGETVGWQVELNESTGEFVFSASRREGRNLIRISLAALERIWAFVYAFLYLFDESSARPGELLTNEQSGNIGNAFELLNWAMHGQLLKTKLGWEEDLPRPDRQTVDAARLDKANRFFLGVVAFFFLHEIAHIEADHSSEIMPPASEERDDELFADWSSAFHLLSELPFGRERIHRCVWIVLGFCIINVVEYSKRKGLPETHPATVQRLLEIAEDFIQESPGTSVPDSDFPLYLARRIITFQVDNFTRDFPPDTAGALRSHLVDLLRKFEVIYSKNANLGLHEEARAHELRRAEVTGNQNSEIASQA